VWREGRNVGAKEGEGEVEDPRRYCGPKEWKGHARSVFEIWNEFEKGQHNSSSVFWQWVKGKVGSVRADATAILHNSWDPLSFFPDSPLFYVLGSHNFPSQALLLTVTTPFLWRQIRKRDSQYSPITIIFLFQKNNSFITIRIIYKFYVIKYGKI